MKINRLLSLFVLAAVSLVVLQSSSSGWDTDVRATSGTPGCSGSGCHAPTASTSSVSVLLFDTSTNTSVTQYAANTTYRVRVSLNKSNVALRGGFQLVVFDINNNSIGTYPDLPNAKVQTKFEATTNKRIVTHNTSDLTGIMTGGTANWEFLWKSPPLGGGNIQIAVTANDANGDGVASNLDIISHSSLFLVQEAATATKDYAKGINALYPNPTSGKLVVDLESSKASDISIYSVTGQLMKEINATGNKVDLDVSELANGSYIINIAQEGNFARQQFVKF